LKEYLAALTSYNTWANSGILKFVSAAGEERSSIVQQSSFPTIRKTVLHMLDAQHIWYSRLNGISPADWPGKNFTDTTMNACEKLVESSCDFQVYANNLTPADLDKVITYHSIKGEPFQNTITQIIAHVMNHGTFHRGQLITMLRESGHTDLASTDMITWFRETGK
jgi:uncharacterized damage-inducible protein DinB